MIGLEGATALLTTRLRAAVPVKLRQLEQRLGLTDHELADPTVVAGFTLDRLPLEAWPALEVIGRTVDSPLARVDVDDAGMPIYAVRYGFRVFSWSRGDDYEPTDTARKRYGLAILEVLAGQLVLDPDTGYVDHLSLAQAYSDISVDPAGATIGGAWTDAVLVLLETVPPPPGYEPRGVVHTYGVDTTALPPHPAL